jgi:hypothetical protein
MGKTHRGKGLWNRPARARGTCPVCGRARIKLLYPLVVSGAQVNVCKNCRHRQVS